MDNFAGDKKVGFSLLGILEKKIVDKYVSKIPQCIETYHLTICTVFWSLGIMFFGWLAANYNIHWLWLSSLFIFLQYLTDLFDGAVGRYRNTGLIKWGYYMDHFLDYIFLCSVLISYAFLFNDKYNSLFFILVIFAGFMVNAYLAFAATNEFKIEHLGIGPTEIRLLFIIINTLLVVFHRTYLVWALPYVLVFSLFGLCYVVYKTQKKIWQIDIKKKQEKV